MFLPLKGHTSMSTLYQPGITPRLSAVRRLVRRFETATLPRSEWGHAARLRISLHYLLEHGFVGALRRMRRGEQRYNARTGRTRRERMAYHETSTVFHLWIVWAFLKRNRHVSNRHVLFGRLERDGAARSDVMHRYYSLERLGSATARRRFVMPDLNRMPGSVWRALSRVTEVAPLLRNVA